MVAFHPTFSPTPRMVANAATMWRDRRNSAEIARALKITETEALSLIQIAREEELLHDGRPHRHQ